MATLSLTTTALTVTTGAIVSWIAYTLLFHGLHKYPGPKLWAITQFPWHLYNLSGRLVKQLEKLHRTYGNVIRIGPNELSIVATSLDTWRTIYLHKPQEMTKNLGGTGLTPSYNGVDDIIVAGTADHARIRKAMAPAFSEKAMRDQEGCVNIYVNKMMSLLRDREDTVKDLSKLFNWMTFDVTGDLAFGEPFGSLDSGITHSWVASVFQAIKASSFLQLVIYYRVEKLFWLVTPRRLAEQRDKFFSTAQEKVDARLAKTKDRKDIISHMYAERLNGGPKMSMKEIHSSSAILVVAGSETSSTLMSGLVYLTLKHPEVHRRLCDEIRGTFSRPEDATMVSVQALEYLNCVISETFRYYPPASGTLPRIVPGEGEFVQGHWIPGGTVVGINHWCTYHSPANFTDPYSFNPDRWLPVGKRPSIFDQDSRNVLQPFSYGSRDCLGKNLAYAEIRLTLCRLFCEFDLTLDDSVRDWLNQSTYGIWDRKPLPVQAKSRL
ncbi:MAG: hypothetical protein Q9162_005950 [Coniocarpon cinnabarinum]